MRSRNRRPNRASALAAVAIGACLSFHGTACDTTAKFTIDQVRIDPNQPLLLVAATPVQSATAAGGAPSCSPGDAVQGFRLDFVLQSTDHEGSLRGNKDLLIRDGDRVSGVRITVGDTITPQNFVFGTGGNVLERISALSAANDQSFPQAGVRAEALQFTRRNLRRTDPVAVAVVVDHSGSARGYVDPNNYYEVRLNSVTVTPVAEAATDPFHERYNKLASDLFWLLNDDDRAVAWFINGEGVNLACNAPELETNLATAPRSEKERFCFQPAQRRWISAPPNVSPQADAFDIIASGSGTVGGIDVRAVGRTPLWTAVSHAYGFLEREAPADMAKHVIVLTDGPDTCDQAGPYWVPSEGCRTGDPDIIAKGFQEFRSELLSKADQNSRIPVSFIQLQSLGYREPDSAQQEVACLTGGTYQWLNSLNIAKSSPEYGNAIQSRIKRLRYTLGGVWSLFVSAEGSLPNFAANAAQIVLDGLVTLNPGRLPLTNQVSVSFSFAQAADNRLLLRRTCSSEADCGGSDSDCQQSCLIDGNTCAPGGLASPAWNVDEPGCCCGSPEFAGTCDAFRSPCCVVNLDVHQSCQ